MTDWIEYKLVSGETGKISCVDSDLKELSWYFLKGYAHRKEPRPSKKTIYMHRLIMERMLQRKLLSTEHVDHINGNILDNCRTNLRLATHVENIRNQKRRVNNTSGYKGVYKPKRRNRWIARICVNNKGIHIGSFSTPEEAYKAYCEKAKQIFGEFFRPE